MTVEYWTMWPQERVDILLPQLTIFEQCGKHIKANISIDGDFRPKLRSAIVAGTPPDASIGEVFNTALYADQKVMLDLALLVKRDRIDVNRDYVINGFEDWCGRLYTFPLDGFSFALVYNKTMLRERGVPDPWDAQKGQWTWDDFSLALTIGGNGDWAYAKAKHPEAGYELIKFFGGDEVQGSIGTSRILPPAQWKARRDLAGFRKAAPNHMSVYNDIWTSYSNRTNRAYHYTDLELAPQLDALINAAFRDERTMKDALVEASRLGNSQVQFGERCYRPPWKRR